MPTATTTNPLRGWRQDHGQTIRRVAIALDVTERTIVNWEKADEPKKLALFAYAELLDIPRDTFEAVSRPFTPPKSPGPGQLTFSTLAEIESAYGIAN